MYVSKCYVILFLFFALIARSRLHFYSMSVFLPSLHSKLIILALILL